MFSLFLDRWGSSRAGDRDIRWSNEWDEEDFKIANDMDSYTVFVREII